MAKILAKTLNRRLLYLAVYAYNITQHLSYGRILIRRK